MNKHIKRGAIGGGAIGVLVVGGLAIFYGFFYIPHFSTVQEGVLYRSGQPDSRDLRRLHDVYGVKTIVNLRRADEQTGEDGLSFEQERAEARRLGMRFIHLPMDGHERIDPVEVRRWLAIARNKDNWPILLHCKRGVDRTGLLAAVYRTEVQGWEPRRALDEAVAERLDLEDKPHMEAYILAGCSPDTRAAGGIERATQTRHALD